ncbi:NAD(P)H-dependent oxidoreductase [Mesorhizobium sp. B2-4-15]|uniref:NAD(P)H-dependent oxidoreductase n=1 Tax=Mesorhizobium sp. B2-4-15 TaxID=2589934 RepID=UPI0032B23B58
MPLPCQSLSRGRETGWARRAPNRRGNARFSDASDNAGIRAWRRSQLKEATEAIVWAQHIVFVFPLWLGTLPAMVKAFLEQVMRPGTAFAYPDKGGGLPKTLLRGRSARVVVTMGMPSVVYRLWFLSHGVAKRRRSTCSASVSGRRSLERPAMLFSPEI